MKFFETTNRGLIKVNGLDSLSPGMTYAVTEIVDQALYMGKVTTYLYEINTNFINVIVTDERGRKPYAVATNDSIRDGFADNCVSKILARSGYYMIITIRDMSEGKPVDKTVILRVDETVQKTSIFPAHILVTCVENSTLQALKKEFPMFRDALTHSSRAFLQSNTPIQLQDKYCFNKSRIFTYAIMNRNHKGEMVSEKHDQMIILNNNSLAQTDCGIPVDTGVYRLFYSKRFSQGRTLIAEGVKLTKENLELEMEDMYSGILESDEMSSLCCGYLTDGTKVFIVNKTVARLIVKVGDQLLKIPLSRTELSYIKNVGSIYKTA